MTDKHIGFFDLVEACREPGCPVCRLLERDARSDLDAMIYERVNDVETRRALRASWGLCNWHTWLLPEIHSSASGAAIVYADVLRVCIDRVRRGDRGRSRVAAFLDRLGVGRVWARSRSRVAALYDARPACPVCARCSGAESAYLDTLLAFMADPQLAAAYAQSHGLCLPHLLRAIDGGTESHALGELCHRTLEKWETLRQDLERFVAKYDYRNNEAFTEAERTSYTRAYEALAGRARLFGNDLHTARAVRSRYHHDRAAVLPDGAGDQQPGPTAP
jgi:hypothetical protein